MQGRRHEPGAEYRIWIRSGSSSGRAIRGTDKSGGKLMEQFCAEDVSKKASTYNNKQVKHERPFILTNKVQLMAPSLSRTCKKVDLATHSRYRAWSRSCLMPRF